MPKTDTYLNCFILIICISILSNSSYGQYCALPAGNTQYEGIQEYTFTPVSDQVDISIDIWGSFEGDNHYVHLYVDLDRDGTTYETKYDLGVITLDASLLSTFTFSTTDFLPGETYNYRIYMTYNSAPTGACDPMPGTWGDILDDSFTYNVPLPIELLSFDAYPKDQFVQIDWVTSLEINNDYFLIEKSVNGVDWEQVVKMEGAGISIELMSYTAYDSDPYDGVSFYRLKQVDFDGQYSYSEIVDVYFEDKEENVSELVVYPNPNNGRFNLQFTNFQEHALQLTIVNQQGQVIWQDNILLSDGFGLFEVSKPLNMNPGYYILVAQSSNGMKSMKKKIVVH